MVGTQSEAEKERRKENEGKREAENLGSHLEISKESPDSGRLESDRELDKWEMQKINNQRYRKMVQRTQNMIDKTDLKPMAAHMDIFQYILRRVE